MKRGDLNLGRLAGGGAFGLPSDLGDKKIAMLAMSKAGKTYGLGDILEELTEAKRPWVAFDPANNLWGLRVLPDGQPSGLPIVVMGGDHGDIPLEKDAGERVAEAFLADPTCLVIDVAFESKTVTRKFVTDFSNRLMRTRSTIERVVVFEEAPEFVPQKAAYAGIQVCKAAVDRIIRIGGNFGYGTIVAAQRSATIDKDVLSQCEALIVMRLTDKRDRKAVKEWIDAKNIGDRVSKMFESLGDLADGEAWLWWPVEDRFEQFRFRKRRTLHPREMKRLGLKASAIELGDARSFVERLKRQLTKTEVAVPADQKPSRKRKTLQASPDPAPIDRVEIEELRTARLNLEGQIVNLQEELRAERQRRRDSERRLEAVRARLKPEYEALRALFEDLAPGENGVGHVDREVFEPWLARARKRGCGRMLEVLLGRPELTKNQLGTLSGVAAGKRTFRAYVYWLKANGLVDVDGDKVRLRAI